MSLDGDARRGLRIKKFGGAALCDGPAIAHVAGIVAAARHPCVVVASAMQGVTDTLVEALPGVARDESQVYVVLEALGERHRAALAHVAPDGDEAATYALTSTLERLERLLYGIAYTEELTPRLEDMVHTFGERLCVPVLAAAIRTRGVQAVHLDAEHAGVRSLGPFRNARPDLERMRDEVPAHLGRMVENGQVPVVTGFYGMDGGGHATLFGRGGSDYVASLLGVALRAETVELWKDVPGFLTTDPGAVDGAVLVPRLGYDEAAELAHFGARVLHPRAVEPVEEAGIPIQIRHVADPDAAGSLVEADVPPSSQMVRAVAAKDRLAVVRLNGPGMAYTPGVAKRVFDQIDGINVLNMATSQATFALLFDEADVEAAATRLQGLVGGVVQSIEVLRDRSLVCVVGRGLGETPGSAAHILEAVSREGVNIEMISLGASDIAIDFIIESRDRQAALHGIHRAFLEVVA